MRRSPRLQEQTASPKTDPNALQPVKGDPTPAVDNKTALAYDERCMSHRCMDQRDHPERPERIKRIFEKLQDDGLVDRCIRLQSRVATLEEVQLVHDEKYVKEFGETKNMEIDDLRLWQAKWNSIYACHDTYDAALLACGNLLECVDAVIRQQALNAVAVIRPPGHHAESDEAYGFCFFNNVAIAAEYARKMLGVGKVLILDWDVHHGNGIQTTFWNDPNVMYISLHRYDHGRFFPSNELNNYTDIGEGPGRGFNINIPWNGRGVGDGDYLEAFEKVVMPIANEFKPELVLVSAGFDAARGDPLGGYRVTPHGYARMLKSLCELAHGRVILALEGGYNLTSISESMAACVRVLLGEGPVEPDEPVKQCSKQATETLEKVQEVLQECWSSLRADATSENVHSVSADIETAIADAGTTIDTIDELVSSVQDQLRIIGDAPQPAPSESKSGSSALIKTGLVFERDVSSMHFCPWDPNHIECPSRLDTILKKIADRGLSNRCITIDPRPADVAEICSYHDIDFIEQLAESVNWDQEKRESFCGRFDDVYLNTESYNAALIAAGSTMDAVKAVLDGRCDNAAAFIRPPGHHAMKAELNGFCIFNNVVVATKMALEMYNLKRILIVDWDVHHGQGTQRPFYDDPRVLYFSIHRYENGTFWPNLRESHWDFIGSGAGEGFNINVPLNQTGLGDAEYVAIFTHILLPVAIDFDPELVIISAGYDAAIGCPEGCMAVSPLCYGHMTRMLMPLASGRLCVVLEGGYCLDSLAEGAAMTLRALLGDYCPKLPSSMEKPINPLLTEILLNLAHRLQDKWPSMKALSTAVDAVLGKLERLPYTPSDPIYKGTPSVERTVFPTKNKYVPRSVETTEHFRDVVQKMMAANSLEMTNYKLIVGFENEEKQITSLLREKMKEDNLENAVRIVNEKRTNEEPVRPPGEGHTEDASRTVGVVMNALDGIYKREAECALVLLNEDTPTDPAVIDMIKYAKSSFITKRVLLVYFHEECRDVLSREFYDDNSVLTISIHGKDSWAQLETCRPESVGRGAGAGFNINLIRNGKQGSDSEDLFALHHVIIPIAYSFGPDLVVVYGESGSVSLFPGPQDKSVPGAFFGYFLQQMQMLAEGKLLVILKGPLDSEAFSSLAYHSTKSLLLSTDRPLKFNLPTMSTNAIRSLMESVFYLRPYWPYLQCLLAPNPNIGQARHADSASGSSTAGAANIAEFLQLEWQSGPETMFIAVPSTNCPHTESVSPTVPGIDQVDLATPCGNCDNVGENWICLTCWKVYCGRYVNEHGVLHSSLSGHPIALSMVDLSAWCYSCNSYIRSPVLLPAKRLLHMAKFGVEMPS